MSGERVRPCGKCRLLKAVSWEVIRGRKHLGNVWVRTGGYEACLSMTSERSGRRRVRTVAAGVRWIVDHAR
jgi:hypothetical protein